MSTFQTLEPTPPASITVCGAVFTDPKLIAIHEAARRENDATERVAS